MATKVKKAGIKKNSEKFFYFVDDDGDIARTRRDGMGRKTKIKKTGIDKKKGFLYYVDGDGDISRSRMNRN